MDTDTITMDADEASEAYEQYATAVRESRDVEKAAVDEDQRRIAATDKALARGYKALKDGKALLSLSDAFERGGFNDEGYPNLAVVQANADYSYIVGMSTPTRWSEDKQQATEGDAVVLFSDRPDPSLNNVKNVTEVRLPYGIDLPRHSITQWWGSSNVRAKTPIIPPALRPPHKLHNYHLLFEAVWEAHKSPRPDPALLKHLEGDLYVVLATWDLTPLEVAVLGG